jgi:hypothetical protein
MNAGHQILREFPKKFWTLIEWWGFCEFIIATKARGEANSHIDLLGISTLQRVFGGNELAPVTFALGIASIICEFTVSNVSGAECGLVMDESCPMAKGILSGVQ